MLLKNMSVSGSRRLEPPGFFWLKNYPIAVFAHMGFGFLKPDPYAQTFGYSITLGSISELQNTQFILGTSRPPVFDTYWSKVVPHLFSSTVWGVSTACLVESPPARKRGRPACLLSAGSWSCRLIRVTARLLFSYIVTII